MRIAIVGQGDGQRPSTWSGIPYNLGQALEKLGADVLHLNANPPRAVLRPLIAGLRVLGVRQPGASHGPELAALRTRWVSRELGRLQPEGVIALNTGLRLPENTRYVTFHDLTVPQAMHVGWSDPALMTPRRAIAWRRRERDVCRQAVMCCTASNWTAASLVADYGIPAERVRTVGFGINAPTSPHERDWDVPRFLFVGREWERKNGPLVLRAFGRLRAEHPSATLTLVGAHPPVDAPGVHDAGALDASLPEAQRALVTLFEQSTCFVMPSLMEPFGIAYLEAGAAGVPSIGTTVGGAATAIGPGGVLVHPGDEQALLSAMLDLSDPVVARGLGEQAADNASRFTWPRVAARIYAALAA